MCSSFSIRAPSLASFSPSVTFLFACARLTRPRRSERVKSSGYETNASTRIQSLLTFGEIDHRTTVHTALALQLTVGQNTKILECIIVDDDDDALSCLQNRGNRREDGYMRSFRFVVGQCRQIQLFET